MLAAFLHTRQKPIVFRGSVFELTPQQPAILDGTCPIQLVICEGAVSAGTRVRVHVETCSGQGEQVRSG